MRKTTLDFDTGKLAGLAAWDDWQKILYSATTFVSLLFGRLGFRFFSRPGVSMSSNGFRWLETLAVANLSPAGDVRYHRVGATYPEKLILFPWLSRPKSYHPLKFSLLLKEALPTAGANATAQAPQGKKVILFSRTTIRWSEGRISCAAPLYMAGMMKFFRNGPTARMHRVRWEK